MRIRLATPAVGLLCLAVASCTTTSPGEPTSATTTEVSSTSSTSQPPDGEDLPSHGAPSVEVPLDTTRFQLDPCSTLTATQAEDELNLPPQGKPEDIALGKGCEWYNTDTRGQVVVGFLTGNPRGLSGFYDANQQGKYSYFTVLTPIEGYPAIASDVEDRRSLGRCIVDVGVTDKLAFDVVVQLSQVNIGQTEPCEMATKVAGMALRTMKEGA